MVSKTIFILENADQQELEDFSRSLDKYDKIFYSKDCKVFKLIDGELFEVEQSLKKVVEKMESEALP